MLVKFIAVRHLTQRGRSTGASRTSVREKGILPTRSSAHHPPPRSRRAKRWQL